MADTAVATARSHSGAVRLPSAQRTPVGTGSGPGVARTSGAPASLAGLTVVSQAVRPQRPSTVLGTTSTEPSDAGSNVKLPKATCPVPGAFTSSVTCAASNTSRSHFSPATNLSCPAGSVIFAAVPQPTRPSPRRTQARASGSGSLAIRSPGSATGMVRTTRRPGDRSAASSCLCPTADNSTCAPMLACAPDLAGGRSRPVHRLAMRAGSYNRLSCSPIAPSVRCGSWAGTCLAAAGLARPTPYLAASSATWAEMRRW